MNSVAEWLASIPSEVTPRDGLVFIQQALDDAKTATDEILARYTGSTLPPPPWPQHAELRQAIDAFEGGKLLLQKAIAADYGDKKEPKGGPLGTRLTNGGRALYREIGEMQKRMEGVKLEDVPALAMQAVKKAAATSIGGFAVALGIFWLLQNLDDL